MAKSSDSPDMFRILVASDIHIGYDEKDKVRGEDSFRSFEEVLAIAKEKKVDFVLLGGDLFHDNKPSQKCLMKCSELLRKYCFGNDEVSFQLVSDQNENFRHSDTFPYVNYEDSNINVSMPVFTIHGNHDDPTGKNPRTYLEILSAAGLINYFGKYMDMEGINLSPLLMTKGHSKLAIYGLGSLPEERLHRFFREGKISFVRPSEDTDAWFNLFVVHQNRVKHGTKYLPEKFLTNLPNLVIWGHEHEAHLEPEYNNEEGFYVYQPGSTVRTSLCAAEAPHKHVALLEIFRNNKTKENKFQMTPIPLKTCRHMTFETVNIDEIIGIAEDDTNNKKLNWCMKKVQGMIDEAEREHSGEDTQPKLPLIRLRVESIKTLPFSTYQFGLKFVGKVANPEDIILFKQKRSGRTANPTDMDADKLRQLAEKDDAAMISNIEDIVKEYFQAAESKSQLSLLNEKSVTLAVKGLVEKEDTDAIPDMLDSLVTECRKHLLSDKDLSIDDRSDILLRIKAHKQSLETENSDADEQEPNERHTGSAQNSEDELNMNVDTDEEEAPTPKKKSPASKGRPKKVTAKKTMHKVVALDSDDDFESGGEDEQPTVVAPPKAKGRRATATAAASSSRKDALDSDDDILADSDIEEQVQISPSKSQRGRGAGRGARRSNAGIIRAKSKR